MKGKKRKNIPETWTHTSLEHACEILDSMRIPVNKSERAARIDGKPEDALYPYYGATGQVDVIDDYIFDGEYVLLGEDGAPFLDPAKAKAYLASGKYWVNNHAHILNALISNKFLCHFLNQVDYSEHVTGTTRLKLTQGALKQIPIYIAPENEQHRIAAKLEELFSELDKALENLESAQKQLKVYRQAVLKHAFEGKLTEQWREQNKGKLVTADEFFDRIKQESEARHEQQLKQWKAALKAWEADGKPGHKPPKPRTVNEPPPIKPEEHDRLPDLPEGWLWVRLAQLFSTSPQNGLYKPANEYGSGTQIIRIDDFYDGKLIRKSGFKRLQLDDEELGKFRVSNSELLINRVNSIEYLGKCALVEGLTEDTVFESNIMKCRLVDNLVSKPYIAAYLASHAGRNRLCENAKHAVNQASINQTDVGNTLVPLVPFAEQAAVVQLVEEKLSQADALIVEIDTHIKKVEALRQSILRRAFSGRLVEQHPNDEPASVLLERIKAEKTGQEKSKNNNTKKRKDAA